MDLEPFVFQLDDTGLGFRHVLPDESEPDAEMMDTVNSWTLRQFTSQEIAIFSLDLCHNRIDRHFSRFPVEELERINKMTPGRPLMERHDLRGSLPRGRFFRSRLYREGDQVSVRPDVYVLRTVENQGFIRSIEGGIYRETSIGFSFRKPECSICGQDLRTCNHVPGRSYKEKTCHYIMRDVLEVLEGSVVSVGSQGTGFVTTANRGVLPVGQALSAARESYRSPMEVWSWR